jgi:hypothetical protein
MVNLLPMFYFGCLKMKYHKHINIALIKVYVPVLIYTYMQASKMFSPQNETQGDVK